MQTKRQKYPFTEERNDGPPRYSSPKKNMYSNLGNDRNIHSHFKQLSTAPKYG